MSIAIGIDLGTTNSAAAVATRDRVKLATGPEGEPVHPSVVSFPRQGGVLLGQEAKQRRAVDPENTISSAKRLIGQNIRAPLVQLALTSMPFKVEEGPNQQPIVVVRGRRMTVPEVAGLLLGHLKRTAEKQFGNEVVEAVITVPANFTDAQRQATKEAGVIAGLEVLRLVNEPTAAALAYGYGKGLDAVVAVFDFGGGTFDVSILKIDGEIFEVLATGGDFFLGGDDADRALAEHLAAELGRSAGLDPRPHPEAMTRLSMAAEEIKCYLSEEEEAAGEIEGLVVGERAPVSLPFRVGRRQFENMIAGYVDRTMDVVKQVVHAAGLEPGEVDDVIMVGGSTRIPAVRRRVREIFGREPSTRINPDEVVAHGAALQASMLSGAFAEVPEDSEAADARLGPSLAGAEPERQPGRALLLDVNPATLSVATAGGYTERLLEKNAPIPIEHTKRFTTARDYQTRVVVECCRGEERRFSDNELLGAVVLDEIEPAPRGDAKVEVTFRVDADGILNVRARDPRTGKKKEARLSVIGAPTAGERAGEDSPEPSGA